MFFIEPCQGKSVTRLTNTIIGDASRDILQVVTAAGEGAQAAIAINRELLKDDGVL